MTKVCHLSSVHKQEDIRVFHKECSSLSEKGYDVYLVTCGDKYNKNGVHMEGIGSIDGGRLNRFLKTTKKIYKTAKALDADIYHFHDPELLPYGLKLKRKGKKVIFDSHEDTSAQIMDKPWIPAILRRTVSAIYWLYETYVVKRLDAVVTATPHIAESFAGRAKRIVVLNNYPKLDDITISKTPFVDRDRIICYAGGINEIRGERIMVDAMKDVDGCLILAGEHEIGVIGSDKMTNTI